jgi:hypothetical protein
MSRLTKAAIAQYQREREENQLLLERIASGVRIHRDGIDVTAERLDEVRRRIADLDVILAGYPDA